MINEKLKAVGEQLVANCRGGNEAEGLKTLYADDAVSAEAVAMPGSPGREASGLDAIQAKHEWWFGAHEVHSQKVEGPFYHGDDRFGVIFDLDVTTKESGERMQMREMGVYTVADGKIVREEFFYGV